MANVNISRVARVALTAGAAGVAGPLPLWAQTQSVPASADSSTGTLEEVLVTGSKVRRSESETASPLAVIDAQTIQQSGAAIVGDLLQRIPEFAGEAPNPQLGNFRNGSGASGVSLRGLGADRTLILLDGRRLGYGSIDVNQIPVNMIERVEILKEGAGAIYGSDAIGGVVNIITKKPAEGLEVNADYGRTTHNDGAHHSFGVTLGASSDRSQIMVGGNYNQQDGITAGQRAYSKYALYLYSGTFNKGGTSATATGRIFLPASLQSRFGCSSVTRGAGAAGTGLGDFGCFGSGGPYAGQFNFQPYNLLLSPQERGSVFFKSSFKVNDDVEAYSEMVYTRTHAGSQNSPVGLRANNDQVLISSQSLYNPFGVDFGGGASVGGANTDAQMLLDPFGPLRSDAVTANTDVYAGLRGRIPGTDWHWDATLSYDRIDASNHLLGLGLTSALNLAFGPSFLSANGTPTCGTAAAPIASCIPANFFNLASTPFALPNLEGSFTDVDTTRNKGANLDVNGTIVELPAGAMLGSVGVDYWSLEGSHETSSVSQSIAPTYDSCELESLACSSPYAGSYNVREGYLELFAPVLKDLPGVQALSIDAGVRYSDYSLFGSTTRSQFKLEYRPIRDVLLRGTYSQVFRAPGIEDLFGGPKGGLVSFTDPCSGYAGAANSNFPNLPAACVGVPTDGSFHPLTAQVPSVRQGNSALKPERGDVETVGLVFSPQWLGGFSASVDFWRNSLTDIISQISPNYAITQCAVTGESQFCDLGDRYLTGPNAGQFITFTSPTFNLGAARISGVDVDLKYAIPDTPVGSWRFNIDWTHLGSFESTPVPGGSTQQIAGTFDSTYSNLTKSRALVGLGWSGWDADALLTVRYIGSLNIPDADGSVAPDGTFYFRGLAIANIVYADLSVGYTLRSNTRIQLGIYNITDKYPPIFGEGWATAGGDTDNNTYDEIGRRFTISIVQKL